MSRNKFLVLLIILALVTISWLFVKNSSNVNSAKVVDSSTSQIQPAPSPTPKTFTYDRTTDLKKELEQVLPEVLGSDFE